MVSTLRSVLSKARWKQQGNRKCHGAGASLELGLQGLHQKGQPAQLLKAQRKAAWTSLGRNARRPGLPLVSHAGLYLSSASVYTENALPLPFPERLFWGLFLVELICPM